MEGHFFSPRRAGFFGALVEVSFKTGRLLISEANTNVSFPLKKRLSRDAFIWKLLYRSEELHLKAIGCYHWFDGATVSG
jgi:hypothetical protein